MRGTVLQGTYTVEEHLGTGGMGAVYSASHARLDRRFAIKVLHRRMSAGPDALSRFRREAEIASKLGHPHIVEVIDFNETDDGEPYIVMELLEGEDLAARLAREGVLSVDTMLHIAGQLGSALSAAHSEGVIHRDLKPHNIFLSRLDHDDCRVKILDFGISKVRDSRTALTVSNAVLGTPGYMSPEQAEGHTGDVDARTDQFAFATILYEALAGANPFAAESIPSMLYQVVHYHPPPLVEVAPDVPDALSDAVARAMNKSPADRFASVAAFVAALDGGAVADRARETDPAGAPPAVAPSARRGRSWMRAAAVAAVALGLAAGVVALTRGAGDRATSNARAGAQARPGVPASPAPTGDRAAAVEPPATVTVRISATPDADRVLLDGTAVDSPIVTLPRGDTTHTIRFEKAGHTAAEYTITADQNHVVRGSLEPVAVAPRRPSTSRPPRQDKPDTPVSTTEPDPPPAGKKGDFITDF